MTSNQDEPEERDELTDEEEAELKERPDPLELAKRTAAVTEIPPAETARLWDRWDQTFGRPVRERTGKPVFGGIRWHAFSWSFTRAESGQRALELYVAEPSTELVVLLEGYDRPSFRLSECSPIDFSRCGMDLYVIPGSFDWTMVFTHEQPSIGPFFSRRIWTGSAEDSDRRGAPAACVVFACIDHHEYVDAGYRWAYLALENAGVVQNGRDVDVARLLAAHDYWNRSRNEATGFAAPSSPLPAHSCSAMLGTASCTSMNTSSLSTRSMGKGGERRERGAISR